MIDVPQFLELSLPTARIRESLSWYVGLGFIEHETRDVRSYPYAVVSAGDICIGFHADGIDAPGLSFVRPEVARYVRQAQLEGQQFEFAAIGEDQFHEARLVDPDGTLAVMMEARTFSPATAEENSNPLTGPVDRLRLPCLSLKDSIDFWQGCGFIVVESDIPGAAELHAPGLTVELLEGTRHVSLIFAPADTEKCLRGIAATDTQIRATPEGHEMVAPEGTRLLIQDLPRS
jgi:hypothetical protein